MENYPHMHFSLEASVSFLTLITVFYLIVVHLWSQMPYIIVLSLFFLNYRALECDR